MPIRSLRSIVAGRPPIVAASITTVVEAARTMKGHNIGALLVVDHARLIGIFTERDALFRLLAEGRDPHATRLADVMTPQPQTIHPDEPFVRARATSRAGSVGKNCDPLGNIGIGIDAVATTSRRISL